VRIAFVLGILGLLAAGCEVTVVDETAKGGGVDAGRVPCTMCGDACVDTATDPSNCGRCGIACGPGEACVSGSCQTSSCDAPRMMCGDACVDTSIDPGNCGGCGSTCDVGEACVGGECQPSECDPPLVQCGEECVDTSSDARHCGTCGRVCDPGQTCEGGGCQGGGDACPEPMEELCGGECLDLSLDDQSCGECGHECAPSQHCMFGYCVEPDLCPLGEAGVCGTGSCCYDTALDPEACGPDCEPCGYEEVCRDGFCQEPSEGDPVLDEGVEGLWRRDGDRYVSSPICADGFGWAESRALCASLGRASGGFGWMEEAGAEWWTVDCPASARRVQECEVLSLSDCPSGRAVRVYCERSCP
jgi:hypothetical protein